jgi:signal transduction histidine kinase
MSRLLAHRADAIGRAGAAVLLAVALAASMQQSRAGAVASLIGGLAIVAAAFSARSTSPTELWRAVALASSGLFLVAATADTGSASPVGHALVRAAGPLTVAAAAVSVLPRRSARWAAAGGLVAGGMHGLVFDPFLDPSCRGCGHVGFAVLADVDRARMVWLVGWLVLAAPLVAAIRRQRSIALSMLAPALVYAAEPHRPSWLIVCVLTAAAATTTSTLRRRSSRIKLQRLLASYEITGAELTDSVRALFADPGLTIGYPVIAAEDPAARSEPAATMFIDAHGGRLRATGGPYTDITAGDELLARINHGTASPTRPDALVDPLTTVTLYRQRATAQLAAEVVRLADRRRRVATAGLATRDRLERDLHDGVQQELLALGLDIRLAIAHQHDGDSEHTELLAAALALVHDAVDQVRAISTGISPPMLATHGIRGAIGALARRRSVTVDTDRITTERFPTEVEQAAFAALSEALVKGSTELSATRHGDVLRLASADGATTNGWTNPGTSPVGALADLFVALGGSLVVDDRHMEATLPCGS